MSISNTKCLYTDNVYSKFTVSAPTPSRHLNLYLRHSWELYMHVCVLNKYGCSIIFIKFYFKASYFLCLKRNFLLVEKDVAIYYSFFNFCNIQVCFHFWIWYEFAAKITHHNSPLSLAYPFRVLHAHIY